MGVIKKFWALFEISLCPFCGRKIRSWERAVYAGVHPKCNDSYNGALDEGMAIGAKRSMAKNA